MVCMFSRVDDLCTLYDNGNKMPSTNEQGYCKCQYDEDPKQTCERYISKEEVQAEVAKMKKPEENIFAEPLMLQDDRTVLVKVPISAKVPRGFELKFEDHGDTSYIKYTEHFDKTDDVEQAIKATAEFFALARFSNTGLDTKFEGNAMTLEGEALTKTVFTLIMSELIAQSMYYLDKKTLEEGLRDFD